MKAGALTTPPPESCRAASSARIASRALWSAVSLAESAAFVAYEASSVASALEAWSAVMLASRLASCEGLGDPAGHLLFWCLPPVACPVRPPWLVHNTYPDGEPKFRNLGVGAKTADHWVRKYVRGASAQRLDWLLVEKVTQLDMALWADIAHVLNPRCAVGDSGSSQTPGPARPSTSRCWTLRAAGGAS